MSSSLPLTASSQVGPSVFRLSRYSYHSTAGSGDLVELREEPKRRVEVRVLAVVVEGAEEFADAPPELYAWQEHPHVTLRTSVCVRSRMTRARISVVCSCSDLSVSSFSSGSNGPRWMWIS